MPPPLVGEDGGGRREPMDSLPSSAFGGPDLNRGRRRGPSETLCRLLIREVLSRDGGEWSLPTSL